MYHYNKKNENSLTLNNQSDKIINQSIKRTKLTREYLLNIDTEKYEIFANFMCYRARLNLIRGNFSDIKKYKRTYPETDKFITYFSPTVFPIIARIRFYLVKYRLSILSIILYKIVNLKNRFFKI